MGMRRKGHGRKGAMMCDIRGGICTCTCYFVDNVIICRMGQRGETRQFGFMYNKNQPKTPAKSKTITSGIRFSSSVCLDFAFGLEPSCPAIGFSVRVSQKHCRQRGSRLSFVRSNAYTHARAFPFPFPLGYFLLLEHWPLRAPSPRHRPQLLLLLHVPVEEPCHVHLHRDGLVLQVRQVLVRRPLRNVGRR